MTVQAWSTADTPARITAALRDSRPLPLAAVTRDPHLLGVAAALSRRGALVGVHADPPARALADRLDAVAFAWRGRIVLGSRSAQADAATLRRVLLHELAHLAQAARGRHSAVHHSFAALEAEATAVACGALPFDRVAGKASPDRPLPLIWLIPLAAGAYVLLRPSPANAPGPRDRVLPSVSPVQVAGEAFALFAVPGGAFALGGRFGLGFIGSAALAGGSGNVALRGVGDAARGRASSAEAYVFDAATGAVIGVVVPGGIRLLSTGTVRSLDWLAGIGMRRSDILLAEQIAARAARQPLGIDDLEIMFRSRNTSGRVADWWLQRRGQITLWRGQTEGTRSILSPLARESGVEASEALVARMRAAGLSSEEIAGMTARWHTQVPPPFLTPSGLAGLPLGAAGIPTTRLPGLAAQFAGPDGVVYFIRLPRGAAIQVPRWGLAVEHEFVVLSRLPPGAQVQVVPVSRLPPVSVDDLGRLTTRPP